MTAHDNNKKSLIRGVTLVEMGLICVILAAVVISVMLSLTAYAKNQDISNNAKLDGQSVEEILRAANNYFAVCPKDTGVTINFLQSYGYLADINNFKELKWDPTTNITATASSQGLAQKFTLTLIYQNTKDKDNKIRDRYAKLLSVDQYNDNNFSWIRAVGNFKSYQADDNNLGPQMGNYIQLMNNSASRSGGTGAKQCQSE